MKNLITYIVGISFSFTSFGQFPTGITTAADLRSHDRVIVDIEQPAFFKHHPANLRTNAMEPSSARSGLEFIPIGSSYNLYSILLDGQSQVSYHPEINSVAFVHRQNYGTAGGSGGLSFDISTDGGATWAGNNILTPNYNAGIEIPNMSGARYPNAAIWNPSGNTNPANAYILAHGPELTPLTGTWGASHYLSANLTGGYVSEVYYSTDGFPGDFFSFGMNYSGDGNLWDVKGLLDGASYEVTKHVFNSVTHSFERNPITILPDWTILSDGTPGSGLGGGWQGGDWQVNFDPSGTTGYAFMTGALTTDPQQTIAPAVLKTTDGGTSWDWLPGYDWSSMTEMAENVIPTGAGDVIPFFATMDAIVGSDNKLHLFAEIYSKYSSNYLDSMYFVYTAYTVFMHLSTSDGTDWSADVFGYSNLPTGIYGFVDIPYRMQIGRTPNGDKLFFSWTNSDSALYTEHVAPDLYVMGYDIATDCYTTQMNVSSGTDFENAIYYPSLSPVVMDNGAGEYELPIVFAQPGGLDTDPAQFFYVKGLTMTDVDFCGGPAADANFTFLVTDAEASFTNTSSYASSYNWDFGDGYFSTLENPTHIYVSAGDYTVCLTATNALGSDVYCDTITIEESCIAPTDITPILITSTLARYTWDAVLGATKYQFQYRPTGTTTWLKKNATTTLVKITGLTPATNYQYRMKTFCGTESSTFSDGGFFTTTARIGEFSDQELLIYPNPATQTVFIDGLGIDEDMLTITCQDITGRLLLSEVFMHYGQTVEVSVESLLPGTYMLHLLKGEEAYTELLVVQ